MSTPPYVAVVGPGQTDDAELLDRARLAGRLLAEHGCVVLTGGLGGVMAAAAAGVAEVGGTAVALLPGSDRSAASPGHTVAVATGLGELRNALLVRSVDAVLALLPATGTSWGTLSEVALAARTGVPVVAVGPWGLPGPEVSAYDDVPQALERLRALLPR
ncbi:TIGR00725 family protein [Nocardioides mesophilus]|uniref:TIGR00725 family protein n=1 Tax=Nocardioides mesophilus TaxID=433659 RepID=A0A7G9RF62_9ACTN|nr:TIGR00725 family protein [Nocardioides mesophilus]QNN54237.1 TIGR00725 family protein [Nocardioides mesophilus]